MTYPGGKNAPGVYQRIINLMPPHRRYVEAFLGSGAVLRHKRPAILNIGIDRDRAAIEAYPPTPGLTLLCTDALDYLKTWDARPDDLIYCDPPYLFETRRSQRPMYRHELSREHHAALLRILRDLPAMVIVSGYTSPLYEQLLAGWQTASYQAMTRAGEPATERLWWNYPSPTALHDYSHLGDDYRERERIKRKRNRWEGKLRTMPRLERQAIMGALEKVLADDDVQHRRRQDTTSHEQPRRDIETLTVRRPPDRRRARTR